MERPDWVHVYRNIAHTYDNDNELVTVTRETLRLAHSALIDLLSRDAYHNHYAASAEIGRVLYGEKNAESKGEQRGTVDGSYGE